MLPDELAERDGDVHAQRVGRRPALAFDLKSVISTVQIARLHSRRDQPAHCAVEHLTMSQCTPSNLGARECVHAGCLLVAGCRVAGPPNGFPSIMEVCVCVCDPK